MTLNCSASYSTLSEWVDTVPQILKNIHEDKWNESEPGKWSRKQEFGHLLDSACNNLQRFVRGQYEEQPHIVYDADQWAALQNHAENDVQQLIDTWMVLNRQILWVVKNIPENKFSRTCDSGKGNKQLHTLEWLFTDYVDHMKHHLDHILAKTGQAV